VQRLGRRFSNAPPSPSRKTLYAIKNDSPLKQSNFLFFALLLALISCKTISFKKYYPLAKDKQIIYLSRVDSTNIEKYDTLICREMIAKQLKNIRPNVLNLSMVDRQNYSVIGNLHLYYFEKPTLDSKERIWIKDKSFAERLYCFSNDKLFVGFGWDKVMSYDTELELLFSKRLNKSTFYKHKNGDYAKIFHYVGKENINLKNKTYRKCIRIDIFETLGMTYKIGTVWFAKNIGLIKWTKFNEREEFIKP
jgi:hypothetical protein